MISNDVEMLSDVTICLITFNREDRIEATVKNIFKVLPVNVDVFVLDNGSKDSTVSILNGLSRAYSKLHVFFGQKNLGVSLGRAYLWRKARTQFVLSVDDDVEFCASDLASMVFHLRVNPHVAVVSPRIIDSQTKTIINSQPPCGKNLPTFYEACFLIRKSVIEAVGPFDHRLVYAGEGLDYALRLRRAGYEIIYDSSAVVVHYDRPRSANETYARRLDWLYSFCLVYWKNLKPMNAVYWSIRNMLAHAKSGGVEFGPTFLVKLPKYALSGAIAGVRIRKNMRLDKGLGQNHNKL